MTVVPFLIYNGTAMQEVKPPKNVSIHLMVLLNDAQTSVVIPYASVWATIKKGSETSFDESLWPMISRTWDRTTATTSSFLASAPTS